MRFLFVVPILATLPLLSQERGSISGTVLHSVTSQPVVGAKVSLDYGGGDAVSDANGRFRLDDVSAGEHYLKVEKSGFAKDILGMPSTPVRLRAGERADGITLRLHPEAVLAGQVVDAKGAPLQASIEVISGVNPSHVASSLSRDGSFRIAGLGAGEYRLVAQPLMTTGYAQVIYYPGVTDPSKAEIIRVTEGQEKTSLRIIVADQQMVTVHGRFDGEPPQGFRCSVVYQRRDRNPSGAIHPGFLDKDRRFTISVPPEKIDLRVQCNPSGPGQPVVVGSYSLNPLEPFPSEIVIQANPIRQVRGTFRLPPGTGNAAPTFSMNPTKMLGILQHGRREPDGSVLVTNLSPDVYSVMPEGLPAGAYVESILAQGKDLSAAGVDLMTGEVKEITLVVATGGASLTGQVLAQSGAPAPSARVSLWRPGATPQQIALWSRYTTTDTSGSFRLTGIAPGHYTITASQDRQRAEAQTIDIAGGSEQTVRIALRP